MKTAKEFLDNKYPDEGKPIPLIEESMIELMEEYAQQSQQSPPESREEGVKFDTSGLRNVLTNIQQLIDYNDDALTLRQLWNDLSQAITDIETLPTHQAPVMGEMIERIDFILDNLQEPVDKIDINSSIRHLGILKTFLQKHDRPEVDEKKQLGLLYDVIADNIHYYKRAENESCVDIAKLSHAVNDHINHRPEAKVDVETLLMAHTPIAIKPSRPAKTVLIDPFVSNHARREVLTYLAKGLKAALHHRPEAKVNEEMIYQILKENGARLGDDYIRENTMKGDRTYAEVINRWRGKVCQAITALINKEEV